MGFAHIINISIAILFNDKFDMDDECRWYFLNFFIDVTFGILFNYLLLKHSSKYFKKKNILVLHLENICREALVTINLFYCSYALFHF